MSAFPEKKRYECVRLNVISVMKGGRGVKFPGKKPYVTLEWPLTDVMLNLVKCIYLAHIESSHSVYDEFE